MHPRVVGARRWTTPEPSRTAGAGLLLSAAEPVLPHSILFVTQTPQPADFTTITALFGNHRRNPDSAPRGGALWIRYEITRFGSNQTPVIAKVAHQPADYNNVSPIYASDDRILFTSDRPRDGNRRLHPRLDEYEEAPVVTGLGSLDPSTGELFLMKHSPSGVFSPGVDSFGRVLFSRWDHLQRDQQADADHEDGGTTYGTFNSTSQ